MKKDRNPFLKTGSLPGHCHYSFIQALSVRMLFITAQSFVGIHLPFFFDKAKTLQKSQCLEKIPEPGKWQQGYLFFYFW
ncbi:hypothetical protein HTS61_04520 [Escherichia coli]|nr:hypothetical protein [Escherichia coli]